MRNRTRDYSLIVVLVSLLAGTASAQAEAAESNGSSQDSNFDVNINLLGLLGLGPTLGLEYGGQHVAFTVRFRAMNLGLLSHVVIADAFDGEDLGFSYGLAGALRFYFGRTGNMRGLFLGPGVEYVSTHVEEENVAYTTDVIVPQFELGYRWVFGEFLFDVGGGLGYAVIVDKHSELLSGGSTLYANDAENDIYAVGTVAVGWFL